MVLIPARTRPLPSAKLSRHMEYRRWKDEERVRTMIDGWSMAIILIMGMGSAFAVIIASILGRAGA